MLNFKSKIGATAVGLSVISIVALYMLIVMPLCKSAKGEAQAEIKNGPALVTHRLQMHAYKLTGIALHASNQESFIKAIQAEEVGQRRKDVFSAITDYDEILKKTLRKSDFFAVVDADGKVIARDLNIQDMFGETLPYGSIKHALSGRATGDIWVMKNRLMRAATAPIYVEGTVKGAIVLAYDMTDAETQKEREQFGIDVVYFSSGAVRSSSFPKAGATVKAVNAQLLKAGSAIAKAVDASKQSDVFEAKLNGDKYLITGGALIKPVTVQGGKVSAGQMMEKTSASAKENAGFVTLVNLSAKMRPINHIRWVIFIAFVILLLLVIGLMSLVARHFVKAQDNLELGVSEVISGNMDYTFAGIEEFEGLANALNVMLARLLGRPEPGEEDDGDQAWRPDVLTISEIRTAQNDQEQALKEQEEEIYFKELYQTYIDMRKAADLSNDGLTMMVFTQKVKANESMLKAQTKSEVVRFVVRKEGNRVLLDPIRF